MAQRWRTEKPKPDEFAPYYKQYIDEVPAGDLVTVLERQGRDIVGLWRGVPESRGDYRYAEGKWSVKDIAVHLADGERVFSYRLMRFARTDTTDLPGFDENIYAKNAGAGARTVASVADELAAVRAATMALISPLDDDAMARRGTANNNAVSCRALAWIMAGHWEHHARVLKERYLA